MANKKYSVLIIAFTAFVWLSSAKNTLTYEDGSPCDCDELKKSYLLNDKIKDETPYKNGVIHGHKNMYDHLKNGSVLKRTEVYKHGKVIAFLKYHMNTNILSDSIPFKDGAQNGIVKTFYPSGALQTATPMKGGVIIGSSKEYYETGELYHEMPYKGKNTIEGIARIYYENGTVKVESPYVNNVKHGVEKYYDPQGKLHMEVQWVKGVPAEEKLYKK